MLTGGGGNDTLNALTGADVLIGGKGNDTLNADDAGADIHRWLAGDEGAPGTPAIDFVRSFTVGTDILDLRDLLHGEEADPLPYFHFVTTNGTTTIELRVDGAGGVGQKIAIMDVNLNASNTMSDADTLHSLLNSGSLLIDQ